jgi:hypothetical protein
MTLVLNKIKYNKLLNFCTIFKDGSEIDFQKSEIWNSETEIQIISAS